MSHHNKLYLCLLHCIMGNHWQTLSSLSFLFNSNYSLTSCKFSLLHSHIAAFLGTLSRLFDRALLMAGAPGTGKTVGTLPPSSCQLLHIPRIVYGATASATVDCAAQIPDSLSLWACQNPTSAYHIVRAKTSYCHPS